MRDALDVWLDGRHAGRLMRGEQERVEFLYEEEYRTEAGTTPLSASMPKSAVGHGPDMVMPWLSNLLPDAEAVRNRWAAKFGERRADPFTLLAHMGEDAPGSVQIVPVGVVPRDAGAVSPLSAHEIARRVRAILNDPDHWVDDTDEDESRFSLGGSQGKFALARIDGDWFEPNGRAPSTHIVKPGMALATGTDDDVQAVEFVTMRSARALGIRAATVEILDFAGIPAFVTTRFDRRVASDGSIARIHQEDFCQALGVFPSRKYEEDGGPTMADMVKLVADTSSPSYRADDLTALGDLFAFDLLTAGVDAHAKNHSMLHVGGRSRLAPAYDLISAHGIWSADRIAFKSAAAVRYGEERRYRRISGRNVARTADVLRMPRTEFLEQMDRLATGLPGAIEAAVSELPSGLVTEKVARMPDRIATFARELVDRARKEDTGRDAVPPFTGATAIGRPGASRVWEPGRWRGDRWVTGRYRSRNSR
ncbi:HipA domain-containing protein [Agromyces mangrovi Wang et al. 2018]|uniref:HipA domain-containing protein n=1 Tax=Agromyces mangrovi TaxID=1858653 RepID=UPI0025735725|nr:HipA domain-containing protein [Agromyces mangrovi]BDZ64842.1 toxin HipA [Agromyces mangrovi]